MKEEPQQLPRFGSEGCRIFILVFHPRQRTSNNDPVYQSITLNGATHTLNWTFPHGSTLGCYGHTINYQMDGNSKQDSYNVYLDNLTFTYE